MNGLCVACRGNQLSYFGTRLDYDYHVCAVCGTLQLAPMPTESELDAAYSADYANKPEAMHDGGPVNPDVLNRDHARYHQRIVEVLKKSGVCGPILEVGCGFGGLGMQALRAGLSWEGVDLSQQAVEYCQKQGLPVRLAKLPHAGEKKYAAIVLCFVFEHLADHDAFLRECRMRLLPGGKIITLHPTAPFARFFGTLVRFGDRKRPLPRLDCSFVPPWHTALLSIDGTRAMAARNGFAVEQVTNSPTGRFGGVARRTAQAVIQGVNGVGWSLVGEPWPLTPAHMIVMRSDQGPAAGN
jgi:SAM-dependent methyltransferase